MWKENNYVEVYVSAQMLFHKLYGSGGNTPQQFDEFISRYNLKEFNDIKVLPKKLWRKQYIIRKYIIKSISS